MEINLGLAALGIFGSYFLRVTAAYLVCLVLAQLLRRPQFKFALWSSFLSGVGVYWLYILSHMAGRVGTLGTTFNIIIPTGYRALSAAAVPAGLMHWGLPKRWGGPITTLVAALPWAYAAGLLLLLLVSVRKRRRLRRILRASISVSPRLQRILDELCDELRIRRCRIMVLTGLTSPATAYSFRPRILVPEALELYLNRAQLRDVLCHELMHVKRQDYFWGSVSELVRCLLFFHPATWLALRHLNRERELACDDAVVRHLDNRRPDYAECLTRLARVQLAEERSSMALNFATSGSFLSLRVRTLLAETQRRPWWQRGLALTAGLALLAGFAGLCPTLAIVLHYVPTPSTSFSQSEPRPQNLPVRERSGPRQGPAVSTKPTFHARELVAAGVAERELESDNEQEPEVRADSETLLPPPPSLVLPRVKSLDEEFTPEPLVSASIDNPAAATPTDRSTPTSTDVPPPRPKRRSGILPGWHKTAAMAAIALGRVAMGGGGQQGENIAASQNQQ